MQHSGAGGVHHDLFAKTPGHVPGAANQAPAGWHALASPGLYLLLARCFESCWKARKGRRDSISDVL